MRGVVCRGQKRYKILNIFGRLCLHFGCVFWCHHITVLFMLLKSCTCSLIFGHTSRVATDKTTHNLDFWPKAVAGEATEEDWRDFVREERLSAAVDFPSSLFWKDLVKIYPNAKVVIFFLVNLQTLKSVRRIKPEETWHHGHLVIVKSALILKRVIVSRGWYYCRIANWTRTWTCWLE